MITKQRGFTLVELNLSVVFVAMLILGIAMTTIQVSRMYQKGVTVKTVNQVGRDVSEQLRRDFASASPSAIDTHAIDQGRVCLGSVSYLFNDAATLHDGSNGIKDQATGEKIVLVRVEDPSATYCRESGPGGPFEKMELLATDNSTELLAADVVPLAVHTLDVQTYLDNESSGIRQSVYRLAITLGTNEVDTIDETAAANCKPPTASSANFDNCFVSKFETVVRAGEISR